MLFGLAGLLVCIVAAIVLSWRGSFLPLAASTAALPLLLLLVGGYALRRTAELNSQIEKQLSHLGRDTGAALQPITGNQPAAIGWNLLVQRLQDRQALCALEARLSGRFESMEQTRWEATFNSLGDGIAVCDARLTIVQANNSLAALLAASSKDELIGRNLIELLQGYSVPACHALLERVFQGNAASACDLRRGEELSAGVLRVTRAPLLGEEFDASSTLWTVRDVTQSKLAEEMRNQFVSTATHELRTPLTNIKAFAELLSAKDEIDVDQQKNFCNIINAEATRLARFIDQLLNVSQMEAGALTLARHETDIERLIGEVVSNVQPQAKQKRIAFESKLPPKLPKLRVDKDKLAGALINLLGNAIKYTPLEGSVKLIVEADEKTVQFHVEDTGIGISAEDLPRLGEKFFRSQDPRVGDITGSGLGLAFSQEVARLHGGKISISSELNKGSRFTLSLPLV